MSMVVVAEIKGGGIYLPSEIFRKAHLPLKGKCNIEFVDDEVRIKPITKGRERMIKRLQKSPITTLPIDQMIQNEVIDVD